MFLELDFEKWDKASTEKAHLRFCKMFLGLNRKSSNHATRAEMGRFPIHLTIIKFILKYYMYLNTKEETPIVKQALYISKETSSKLSNSYNNNIVEILKFGTCYNLRNSGTLSNEIISDIICKIKTKYIDFWKTKVETSKRLDFFKQFKQNFSTEPFLDSLNNFNIKRVYIKYRASSHCWLKLEDILDPRLKEKTEFVRFAIQKK